MAMTTCVELVEIIIGEARRQTTWRNMNGRHGQLPSG